MDALDDEVLKSIQRIGVTEHGTDAGEDHQRRDREKERGGHMDSDRPLPLLAAEREAARKKQDRIRENGP